MIINQGQAVTGPTYNDVLASQQLATTYANVASTRPVLAAAATSLRIPETSISSRCPCILSSRHTVLRLGASVPLNTVLVQITAESPAPTLAAHGADAVAAAFTEAIYRSQLGDVDSAEQDLNKQIGDAQARIQASIGQIQQLTAQARQAPPVAGAPADGSQLASLQTQLSQEQSAYAALVGELEQIRLGQARAMNAVKVVEPAVVPFSPLSPRTSLNTALGALLGLLAGAALAFLFEYLDDRVRTPRDVERITSGGATLGIVDRFSAAGLGGMGLDSRMLLLQRDGSSRALEEYRIVRTNLEFARAGRQMRTIVVTSAAEHEGKTTVASNLAIVLSQTAKRVLLVDADLRRPALHRVFDLPNSVGFSTIFLIEYPQIRGIPHTTPYENLSVLTAGPLPPNPPEILSSPRMAELLSLFEDSYDVALFDSPPLLAVGDAAEVAARVDGTILVVDTTETRPATLQRASDVLMRASATMVGVVLNKVRREQLGAEYYYYTGIQYPYGNSTYGVRNRAARADLNQTNVPVSSTTDSVKDGALAAAPESDEAGARWA